MYTFEVHNDINMMSHEDTPYHTIRGTTSVKCDDLIAFFGDSLTEMSEGKPEDYSGYHYWIIKITDTDTNDYDHVRVYHSTDMPPQDTSMMFMYKLNGFTANAKPLFDGLIIQLQAMP